jgi:hypothetical protein
VKLITIYSVKIVSSQAASQLQVQLLSRVPGGPLDLYALMPKHWDTVTNWYPAAPKFSRANSMTSLNVKERDIISLITG